MTNLLVKSERSWWRIGSRYYLGAVLLAYSLVWFVLGVGLAVEYPREMRSLPLICPGVNEIYEWLFFTPEEKISTVNIKKELGELTGNAVIAYISTLPSLTDPQQRPELIKKITLKIDFEAMEKTNVPLDLLAKVIFYTYPRAFLSNIRGLTFREEEKLSWSWFYGRSFNFTAMAHPITRKIIFLYGSGRWSFTLLFRYLPHEAAHLNDWNSNLFLTRVERLALLEKWLARTKVKNLAKEESEKKQEDGWNSWWPLRRYMETIEYFAKTVSLYFRSDDDWRNLDQEDQKLAEDFIQKLDPSFDWIKQIRQRGYLWDRYYYASSYSR